MKIKFKNKILSKSGSKQQCCFRKEQILKFYNVLKEIIALDVKTYAIFPGIISNFSLLIIPENNLYYFRQLIVDTSDIYNAKYGKLT